MNIKTRIAAFVLLIGALTFSSFAVAETNVGFRKIKTAHTAFAVWHPTNAAPNMRALDFFPVVYAENAAPSGKNLPLVVLSHGNGGRFRNHHLTASHLAKNGFVVIAPQHKHSPDMHSHLHSRVGDIKLAIATLQNNKDFAPVLDSQNINAIGYSLGGATALAAAGANVDWESFLLHCARDYAKDENACADFPFWIRFLLRAKHYFLPNPKKVFWNFSENPIAFRKIALIAPVGKPMDAESLANVSAKVLLLQIDGDAVLRSPFHSEHLRDNLPPQTTQYELIKGGYHYGFVAPFPQRILDAEHIPEMKDPPGFNREKFIATINEKILAFLRAN